jgi:serralysin
MATLTYYEPGTALLVSATGGRADNSLTGITDTLQSLTFLTPTTENTSEFIGDFRLLNNPASQMFFFGTGFSYSVSGIPIGGVISGWQLYFNGQLVSTLAGISVSVPTLSSWISNGQYALAGATVFGGNDTITAPTGVDVIAGYGGIDTAVLPDSVKEDTIIGAPPGSATVTGPDISDTLTSVERVQFIDGTLYYDISSPAAQIERMYQAALGRAPDPIGRAGWVAAMKGGGSLNQVAAFFIGSAEFQTRFPGASQNATAFVTQLYSNVLHRAPDSPGLSAWVGVLQSGVETQAQVLMGFSESAENQGNTAGAVTKGIWVADEQAATVARLYYSALGRGPDAGGLIAWTNALKSGGQTLLQEATAFASSSEFQGKYGNLTNADFVNLLYHNVLGRQADSAGLAAWTGTLNTGSLSRAGVLVGFSEGLEHQVLLAPKIEASGVVFG